MLELLRRLREALAAFDPAALSADDRRTVAEELARTEKACAGVRALVAAKVDDADWLARISGSTVADARGALAVAAGAPAATRAALVAGELSMRQAEVVVATEAACPGSEAQMLAQAPRSGLAALRDEGRRRRLGAVPVEELFERQHRARELRHWVDDAGMVRMSAALPPVVGVALVNRLDAETDRRRRAAKAEGRDEPRAAHAADALIELASGRGGRPSARADVVVVCDLRAWRRGHGHAGEACHVVGGGPVPVRVAKAMADDAFLKAVTHDGVRIDTVAHYGRHIPAELRTALELGPVPSLEGAACADCDRRYGLEWDHVDPVAKGGLTSYRNLQARCWPHHQAKTERDRQAGLLGAGVPP